MRAADQNGERQRAASRDACPGDNHRGERHERKVVFMSEISRWVEVRRDIERLTREQLGALDGIGRLQAQRQSLLDNMAHYFRVHPGADSALGVLMLATVFSDNNDGCCTLSNDRMARFLSRSPRRITAAIAALNEARTIVVERVEGGANRIYPWVHSAFGSTKDPLTWIIDVRAPRSSLRKPGRPSLRNTPDAGVTPISGTPLTLVTNTPDTGDQIPLTPASPNTTNTHTTREGEMRERAPGRASRSGSAADISDGVQHLTDACIAQRFGSEPRGRDLAQWQQFLDASPECRQLSNADAAGLASAIVAAGERFWPAAAAICDVVAKRAQRMATRVPDFERHRTLLPLREAYLSDMRKFEEIENSIPRIDQGGPGWRARLDERAKAVEALKAAAGIDLSRYPQEVTIRDFRESPWLSYPIGFSWPERRVPHGKLSG